MVRSKVILFYPGFDLIQKLSDTYNHSYYINYDIIEERSLGPTFEY